MEIDGQEVAFDVKFGSGVELVITALPGLTVLVVASGIFATRPIGIWTFMGKMPRALHVLERWWFQWNLLWESSS